jgi:hypothetical protein
VNHVVDTDFLRTLPSGNRLGIRVGIIGQKKCFAVVSISAQPISETRPAVSDGYVCKPLGV